MTSEDHTDGHLHKLHTELGRFFLNFSLLEQELGNAIKTIYKTGSEDAALVYCFGDFARKVHVVAACIASAEKSDGTPLGTTWVQASRRALRAATEVNDERNRYAHRYLQPTRLGGLHISDLKFEKAELVERCVDRTLEDIQGWADKAALAAQDICAIVAEIARFALQPGIFELSGAPIRGFDAYHPALLSSSGTIEPVFVPPEGDQHSR
jgi:hypothetical protein